jgi:hypothetical protein
MGLKFFMLCKWETNQLYDDLSWFSAAFVTLAIALPSAFAIW